MNQPEFDYELACSMCFFKCTSNNDLVRHVVRCHQHDPQFRVECQYHGCGSTFVKWKSFQQHMYRIHSQRGVILRENEEDEEPRPELDLPGNLLYEDDDEAILDGRPADECREPNLSSMEKLQWCAAKFIINIREKCKVSQTAVESIIEGATSLMNIFSTILMEEVEKKCDRETKLVHFDVFRNVLIEEYPPATMFVGIRSKSALDKMLIENFRMVCPKKKALGTHIQWKKKTSRKGSAAAADLCEVTHYAYNVPFLDNLKNLLENDEIRFQIGNPKEHDDDVMRTVLDGSRYRENEFFRDENALGIVLYYDEVGIANPLGSAYKTHQLSMFYWTLANIYPEVRSSLNAVQLLAIVKSSFMKHPDTLAKVLESFITDIKTLQTIGVDVTVNGHTTNFKGSLLFCAADTPAASLLGGFKKSVSAYRPCRSCMTTRDEWKLHFRESDFFLRDAINHQTHIDSISEPGITKDAKNFWQKQYGVIEQSPLMSILHFDVTTCLPQDAMHILIEGIVEITCRATLQYCIIEREIFSLDQLNDRLRFFDYGPFSRDKPAPIDREHLTKSNLRQSAAQKFVLVHTLPFLIHTYISACEDQGVLDRVDCYVLLLQIMNVCLAYEIHVGSIDLLSRMIETFILRFNRLYPDTVVPKFHFLLHIPRYIRMFGPGRQQWCFRFEAAHAYFKSLVPVVRNFKNMPFTLSYRHQARLCSELTSYPGAPSKQFLYKGDHVDIGPTVLLNNLPYARLFDQFIPEAQRETCQIMRTSKIIVYGTKYIPQTIVLWECNENALPVFAEISDMFILKNNKVLVLNLLVTVDYEDKLNAYRVMMPVNAEQCVRAIRNLLFPHPLFCHTVTSGKYVSLINNDRTEFIG